MFIGHYGVSLAAKRLAPEISLGTLFLAVQTLDLLFMGFVLAGIEKLRIVPGFTASNAYELYFMPYSHSLVAALGWSLLFALAWRLAGARSRAALVLGAAVGSHFVLDLPVHTPDLPVLGASSPKLGFGLWQHRGLTIAAELAVLLAGLWLYLRAAPSARGRARGWTLAFAALLGVLTVVTPYLPPPSSPTAFAVQALGAYFALAGLAAWIDRARNRAP